jgi:alkaline phosphatase
MKSVSGEEENYCSTAATILYLFPPPYYQYKSGIGWTSYSLQVFGSVYAYGVGSEIFNGYYDNTDVFNKLVEICEIA